MPTRKRLPYHIPAIIGLGIISFMLIAQPFIYFTEKLTVLCVSLIIIYLILKRPGFPFKFKRLVRVGLIIVMVFGFLFAVIAAMFGSSWVRARSQMNGNIYTISEDDHFYEETTFTLTRHSLSGSQVIGTRFFVDGYNVYMSVETYNGRPYISTGHSPMHEAADMKRER